MSHPPLQRFLGLDEDASDRTLLGLEPGEVPDNARITAALDDFLARLDRHPAARSASAALVRRRLGEAAGRLMASSSRPSKPVPPSMSTRMPREPEGVGASDPQRKEPADSTPAPPPLRGEAVDVAASATGAPSPTPPGKASITELTEFDRTVLAILVGSGGWNATSRGRLIGLATRRGLKPQALMRIVSGLAQLLHGGGFETIAGTRRAIDVAVPAPFTRRAPTRMEVTMNQVAGMLASEFRGDTSGARMRLAIGFSIVAILLVGLFVALLMLPSPVVERAQEEARREAARQALVATQEEERTGLLRGAGAFAAPQEEPIHVVELVPQAQWPQTPNFRGDRRPRQEVLRSHDAPNWIAGLDTLARKASLPQNAESIRLRREFTAYLEDAGRCWPLLEPSIRAHLIAAMAEPVAASASTHLREDLVTRLGEELGPLEGPRDVWSATWAAGILGTIVADRQQPEGARILASELLSIDLGPRRRTRGTDEKPFEVAVGRKLDAMVGELFAFAANEADGADDAWELWIEAQKAIRRSSLLDVAWLDAILVVLRKGYGLEQPGMQVDVFGRLLSELDFSARAFDPELLRMNIRSWFEEESIPAENLWVLSSLMAQSIDVPWWDAIHVLAPDASMQARGSLADSIEEVWPQRLGKDRPRGILVPGAILQRLESVQDELAGMDSAETDVASMYRLLASARATAAAEALEIGEVETALEALALVESMLQEPFIPSLRPAHLIGERVRTNERDGVWTEQWNRTRRDVTERQSQLRRLKQRQGGDLGRVDASSLASEAFRGTPREIRLLAQEVVIDSYALGSNMALALLNQFEHAPRNQDTADFILRLTAVTLPPLSDEGWRESGRLVVARHAFDVHETTVHDVARLAEGYADVLRVRLRRLGEETYFRLGQPQEAAGALVDLIQRRAGSRFVTDPVPASLDEIDRRRSVRWTSAVGPAQQLAAELAALADLAAYETSGMRPDLRRRLVEEHAELTSRVAVAPNVLEQILLLEEAVGRLVAMRLQAEEGGSG